VPRLPNNLCLGCPQKKKLVFGGRRGNSQGEDTACFHGRKVGFQNIGEGNRGLKHETSRAREKEARRAWEWDGNRGAHSLTSGLALAFPQFPLPSSLLVGGGGRPLKAEAQLLLRIQIPWLAWCSSAIWSTYDASRVPVLELSVVGVA